MIAWSVLKRNLKFVPCFKKGKLEYFLSPRSVATLDSDNSEIESEKSDVETERESETVENLDLEKGIHFEPYIPVVEEEESNGPTPARRKWVCCTWCLTWWIPVRFF
jgi:chitin synthase